MTLRITLAALLSASLMGCPRPEPPPPEADTDTDTDADTDADTDVDTDTDADTDTDTGPCPAPSPTGPWDAGDPVFNHPLFNYGNYTSTNYTVDAGIAALFAADTNGGTAHDANGPAQTLDPALAISGAIVIAKDFNDVPVWIADQNRAIQIFGVDEFATVNIGDAVSFSVTEITNYYGELEITGIEAGSLTVDSSNNAVYIADATGATVDYGSTGAQMVEFYGTIVGPTGENCGSGTCYAIEHNGVTQTFNLGSGFTATPVAGDCMHLIAPVTYNWGAHRISVRNFDWIRFY